MILGELKKDAVAPALSQEESDMNTIKSTIVLTHIIFVSHSAGEVPVCISQHRVFEPRDDGFVVVCQT